MRRRRAHLLALLLLGAPLACRGGASAGVSDSTFVATMAELRRVQLDTATDSASRAAARARVLQRRGLTTARLEQAARALAADPERANKVFMAIARKTALGGVTPRRTGPIITPSPSDSLGGGPTRGRLRRAKGGGLPAR